MYDWYEPVRGARCPLCRGAITGWQSDAGPCELLVFREGVPAPIRHDVDPQWQRADLASIRHPDGTYPISGGACGCRGWEARIFVDAGTWNDTRLVHDHYDEARPAERWAVASRI